MTDLSQEDRTAIVETCSKMTYLIDAREWSRLSEVLAEEVTIDYTDIFGGTVATTPRESYIENAARLLGNLDATQHHVAGHLVTGGDGRARCVSQVIATHLKATGTGDPLWTVGAQYEMTLSRYDGAWRIDAVRAVQRWCSGNREVLRLGKADR
jgi:hypothetical protein